MRLLFLALLSLLCASCASTRKQTVESVDILEIKPRYIEAERFKRITEYMTGAEHKGRRVIIRTDAAQRGGFYFTLILNQDVRDLPQGTLIEGEFFTPKSKDAQTHTFELPSKRPKTKEISIGLTGEDWPVKDDVPAAWRFTIKDANGDTLETKQSYLWSL
ncbi:MAG TPA: hypothetical protein DD423_08595 [Opitutae bacterium]|jgi:hypothetical protein|nr:hypothetical protein [Opitutae bacterium]